MNYNSNNQSHAVNAAKVAISILLILVILGGIVCIALSISGVFGCNHKYVEQTEMTVTDFQKLEIFNGSDFVNFATDNITDDIKKRYAGLDMYTESDEFYHLELTYKKQPIVIGYIDCDGSDDFYVNGRIVNFDVIVGGEDAIIAIYFDCPLDDGTNLAGIGIKASIGFGSGSRGVEYVIRNCDVYYQFFVESTHHVCSKCGHEQ